MSVMAVNRKSSPIVEQPLSKLRGTMTGRENCTYRQLVGQGWTNGRRLLCVIVRAQTY